MRSQGKDGRHGHHSDAHGDGGSRGDAQLCLLPKLEALGPTRAAVERFGHLAKQMRLALEGLEMVPALQEELNIPGHELLDLVHFGRHHRRLTHHVRLLHPGEQSRRKAVLGGERAPLAPGDRLTEGLVHHHHLLDEAFCESVLGGVGVGVRGKGVG